MIDDIAAREWDVIVIGAGVGGGLAGRRLAERGLSVLFVEAGPTPPRDMTQDWGSELEDPEARRALGLWPDRIHATVDGAPYTDFGPVGTGVGGTSKFYASTLERPERHDVDDLPGLPHPTGGWPIRFDALLPYLEAAEAAMEVCGEPDPLSRERPPSLRAAPPLSLGDAQMMETMRAAGLHPYRKHVGVRYLPGCRECFGSTCPRACKMDGRSAGVEPAVATGRATVLGGWEVAALRGAGDHVDAVEVTRDGRTARLRARRYVLAAGAYGSPRVLLASASEAWPQGCANRSGQVGRNLMFHLMERIAIWPLRQASFDGPINTIAIRDFYRDGQMRLGMLQSMGLRAGYGDIVQFLNESFDRSRLRRLRPLRELTRIPAFVAAHVFGDARIFLGVLEDLPYAENRILLDPANPRRIVFKYRMHPELQERRVRFRRAIKAGLGAHRSFFINLRPELSLSHVCGTLRFGDDPATSVFDPDCRAHDLRNLFLSDASFMPTSMGVNPSLTIAANALRVADAIAAELGAATGVRLTG